MINEEIREKEVRVIDSDGSQLGIIPSRQAFEIAMSKNLDLVMIAPKAEPPVCRIMDYGKYVFEQSKKEKEARKNQHVVSLKEIRLTLVIGEHDLNTKLNNAIRILKDGNKLKVTVRFRSRELHNAATGIHLLNRFAEACSAYSVVEKPPKLEGRNMIMFLAAKAPEK